MGGEGPATRFSQDSTTISFWANRIGLKLFDRQQQEDVYSKAREFLLERGSILIADYGYQNTTNTTSILHLSRNGSVHPSLVLPAAFASFLEASEADKWSKMFDAGFNAKRMDGNLFLDSPTPLSDIFYLLQTLLPGMLLIYRIDDLDDAGEHEWTRALPPADWVELHKELLQMIFGDSERYGCLLAAAADRSLALKSEIINYERYDDYDSGYKDFTACDAECGYCGNCDY